MPAQQVNNHPTQVEPSSTGPTVREKEQFNSALRYVLQQSRLQIAQMTNAQQMEITQDSVES